jgi:hypothetical protein
LSVEVRQRSRSPLLAVAVVAAVLVLVLLPYRAPAIVTSGRVCVVEPIACERSFGPEFGRMISTDATVLCLAGWEVQAQSVDVGTGMWRDSTSTDAGCRGGFALRLAGATGLVALWLLARRRRTRGQEGAAAPPDGSAQPSPV